jgi:glycosyltransferase involved in cell wall biosynthesis
LGPNRCEDEIVLSTTRMTQIIYNQMLVSPHVGGAAKIAMEIHKYAEGLRGPMSQLLLPKGGEAERTSIKEGFPFVDYHLGRLVSPNPVRSWFENCCLYFRTIKYGRGLVHVHSPFVYGAARPFFLASKLKTVLHVHLNFTEDQLRWALKSPPDLIFVCADFIRPTVEKTLAEGKGERSCIRVILNAVDTKRFFPSNRAEAKAAIGLREDVPLLMMVANLSPHKGQETAIRALGSLKAKGVKAKLWLVGNERSSGQNYLDYLKSLTAELKVGDLVTFVGFRNDIPELLRTADFLLLPSVNEGLPLVILEAQASKAVVLASPTAGIPEIVKDNQTGYLIAADDYQGYAEKISELLMNPSRYKAIEKNAYENVCANHKMSKYCEKILQEYDKILKN